MNTGTNRPARRSPRELIVVLSALIGLAAAVTPTVQAAAWSRADRDGRLTSLVGRVGADAVPELTAPQTSSAFWSKPGCSRSAAPALQAGARAIQDPRFPVDVDDAPVRPEPPDHAYPDSSRPVHAVDERVSQSAATDRVAVRGPPPRAAHRNDFPGVRTACERRRKVSVSSPSFGGAAPAAPPPAPAAQSIHSSHTTAPGCGAVSCPGDPGEGRHRVVRPDGP
jgi:hypothetical protein